MKTQNNKLSFNKNTMVELSNDELSNIDGGSYVTIAIAVIIVTTTFKLK